MKAGRAWVSCKGGKHMNTEEPNNENQRTSQGQKSFGTSAISRNGMTFLVGSTEAKPAPTPDLSAQDPWVAVERQFPVGTKVRCKVVNFKPYGVFVETDNGFFGLVHGSQITGWDWHRRFDEVFCLGQELDVVVTRVDAASHRMAFSYDMPEGMIPSAPEPEPEPEVPLTHAEIAQKWTAENPEASQAARDWLVEELASGPLYGPLASALSDRFGVPVPVSFWIRQFPEFSCYSGKGDNPCELPAVALVERANDAAYWENFKTRASDLACAQTQEAVDAVRFGKVAARLGTVASFPGKDWIDAYGQTTEALAAMGDRYGVADTLERLVVPMFEQLGWPVGDVSPVSMVRGERGGCDLLLYSGEAGAERLAVAVVCDRIGTSFYGQKNLLADSQSPSSRNVIERVLGYANRLRGVVDGFTRIVWTDGREWVVFTQDAMARRIGILSDRRGECILEETRGSDENLYFRRIVVPPATSVPDWLSAYVELRDGLGREKF